MNGEGTALAVPTDSPTPRLCSWRKQGRRSLLHTTTHWESNMPFAIIQLALAALLIYGVVAAPFLADQEAHHFIRSKRQTDAMQGYWDPNSANNVWGVTPAEQASEYWTSLRDSAQYYIGLSSVGFASDPSVVQEHIRSYMDYLRQTSAYLQHRMNK
ncbi:uncharacterized protein C3orf85 homolog [Amblyraja radiata]|uniref:uncharacterized protein C3orf85 homolog n=1 Tax=Amblyraja radiata TaxID=386614 RepID=UPI001402D547|nr:uncharacterized protein C3orf85 homolog [Amblyraja radiata]